MDSTWPARLVLNCLQLITCGAEALTRQNEKLADAQGWALAQNFKLRLHPNAVIEKNDLALDGTFVLPNYGVDAKNSLLL